MDEKIIEEWINSNSNYGFGSSNGDGCGDGNGNGCGDGYGYGSNSSNGFGSGYGYGYGHGFGDGTSHGSGDGCGYSCGWGIKYFNKQRVWNIDDVSTIIKSIHGDVGSGYILNQDFTLEKTFVCKGHGYFAHGKTIKEARQSLEEKIFDDIDIENKLEEFRKKFKKGKKYSGHDYFTWHHNLTGSCLQGRNNFVENNGINLDDKFTVKEFLEIVKDSYGWSVLEKLVKEYE
nr:MAG TPA: hypothetical protein [Caudoviricetes sp.]